MARGRLRLAAVTGSAFTEEWHWLRSQSRRRIFSRQTCQWRRNSPCRKPLFSESNSALMILCVQKCRKLRRSSHMQSASGSSRRSQGLPATQYGNLRDHIASRIGENPVGSARYPLSSEHDSLDLIGCQHEGRHVIAEFARLKDELEVVHEPKMMPWGNRAAQFRDPEGTLVGLYTPVTDAAKPTSPQASQPANLRATQWKNR